MDPVASAVACVGEFKCRNPGLDRAVFKTAMTFLLGEEIAAVGHDETHVASASLIDAGKVDLVKDAVAYREPNLAVLVERRTDAAFGTRCPARRNAGPTWSITWSGISHTKPCPRDERHSLASSIFSASSDVNCSSIMDSTADQQQSGNLRESSLYIPSGTILEILAVLAGVGFLCAHKCRQHRLRARPNVCICITSSRFPTRSSGHSSEIHPFVTVL